MKLHLQNFCCWENETFEFNDTGSVLLSAPSGTGKTSILRAIEFVLFGGKSNVLMYGKKKCKVELWYKDLHIIRRKRPDKLVVNDVYEGDAGQSIINKYFDVQALGLSQKGKDNFVSMTPSKKLEFLESIIFNDIDIDDLKSMIKKKLRIHEDKSVQLTSEINTLTNIIETHDLPDVPRPTCISDSDDTPLKIQTIIDRLCDEKYSLERALDDAYKQEQRYTHLKKEQDKLQVSIQHTRDLIQARQYDIEHHERHIYPISKLDDECSSINNDLSIIQRIQDIQQTKKQYLIQKKEFEKYKKECKALSKEIKTIQKELKQIDVEELEQHLKEWRHYHTLQSYREQLVHEYKNLPVLRKSSDIITEIEQVQQNIQNDEHTLNELSTLYTCPECETSLKLTDQQLVRATHISENNKEFFIRSLAQHKSHLKELESERVLAEHNEYKSHDIQEKLNDLKDTKPELPLTQEEYEQQLAHYQSQTKLLRYQQNKYTETKSVFDEMNKRIKDLAKQSKQKLPDLPQHTESELRDKILDLERERTTLKNHIRSKQEIEQKQLIEQSRIDELEQKYKEIQDEMKHMNYISPHTLHDQLAKNQQTLYKVKQYKTYYNQKTIHDQRIHEKKEKQKELDKVQRKILSISTIKDLVVKAENIALTHLVHTINTNVQAYTDAFFPDEPLDAQIQLTKETAKNVKDKVNIVVSYKNDPDFKLTSLSGGEYDRLVLAFTLAIADMNPTPILMLDECVSSLDQENTENVFSSISTIFQEKLVIVVAHQIVTGLFNQIVYLK